MRFLIRYFFKTIRLILGPFMILWEKITTPRGVVRSDEEQKQIDQETASIALYQYRTCPFCIKVRRNIHALSLNIETRDAQNNPEYRQELLKGGGQLKVPCLKIRSDDGEESWLYESDMINDYLNRLYGEEQRLTGS